MFHTPFIPSLTRYSSTRLLHVKSRDNVMPGGQCATAQHCCMSNTLRTTCFLLLKHAPAAWCQAAQTSPTIDGNIRFKPWHSETRLLHVEDHGGLPRGGQRAAAQLRARGRQQEAAGRAARAQVDLQPVDVHLVAHGTRRQRRRLRRARPPPLLLRK